MPLLLLAILLLLTLKYHSWRSCYYCCYYCCWCRCHLYLWCCCGCCCYWSCNTTVVIPSVAIVVVVIAWTATVCLRLLPLLTRWKNGGHKNNRPHVQDYNCPFLLMWPNLRLSKQPRSSSSMKRSTIEMPSRIFRAIVGTVLTWTSVAQFLLRQPDWRDVYLEDFFASALVCFFYHTLPVRE